MKADKIERALYRAIVFVERQVHAGKHAQDRADAEVWLVENAEIVKALREKFHANAVSRKKKS